MAENLERSISLPGEPTRLESPETNRHLYMTKRTQELATRAGIKVVTGQYDVIGRIGESVRVELNMRDLRIQSIAPSIGNIVIRTNHVDLRHPLWDTLLHTAKPETQLYEQHPNREPEVITLGNIVARVQTDKESSIQQVSVDRIENFSRDRNDRRSVQDVAESFLTGIYTVRPDRTLEQAWSWGDHVGSLIDNPLHTQDYFTKVAEDVAKRWVIGNGDLPFNITKNDNT